MPTQIHGTTADRSIAPTRIDVEPRGDQSNLVDPILRGLVCAQVGWVAKRDIGALRRRLAKLLLQLGSLG
ncbi:MAG: hypothetical protein H6709_10495 [Kofleriaceae bacterium]|nr:hypothetical protein [Kofleriaceae bacterium]MCB9572504.1 hypothetical protein [Kofleriaceae bacterium]